MATVTQQVLRGRPAREFNGSIAHFVYWQSVDPAGPTCLTYTPDGTKLVTAGSNDVIRVYTTGSDGEPTNIDDCQENNTAIAATVGKYYPINQLKLRLKQGLEQTVHRRIWRWHSCWIFVGDIFIR